MTEPTPTREKMLQAQEQCAKDARAIAMLAYGDERAARMVYVDALDATAALLRRLSDPSDEAIDQMVQAFGVVLYKTPMEQRPDAHDAAMRAALSELLTGEATNDDA